MMFLSSHKEKIVACELQDKSKGLSVNFKEGDHELGFGKCFIFLEEVCTTSGIHMAQNFPFCNKNNTIKLLLSHKHLDQDHADQSGNMMRCLSVNESMYIG